MRHFIFSPDATPSGGSNDEPINHTGNLPTKDADLATLGVAVSDEWKKHPTLTLQWKTQPEFATDATNFDSVYGNRLSTGANRQGQTKILNQLDDEMDGSLKYVKGYILEKWKDADAANYARYGIVHGNKNYKLPEDRDKRLDALKLMKQAIHDDGFDGREYGKAFWEKMYTDYYAALKAAKGTDSSVSGFVGDKNVLREEVRLVLTCIIHLIKANFPKTYKSELRKWGFLKEDY